MTMSERGRAPTTLDELLGMMATRRPRQPLLVWGDQTWTYAETNTLVDQLAAGLVALGLAPGDHLAVVLPNCPEFVQLLFAAARAGLVFVPLNPAVSPPELQHLLADSEARAVVATAASLDLVRAAAADCPRLEWLITLEDGIGGDVLPLSRLRATTSRAPSVRPGPDDVAAIVYTSGSTALPKGVMIPHRAYAMGPPARARRLGWTHRDRALLVMPLFHVNAQALAGVAMLSVGGTLVLRERFSASAFWDDVDRYQVSVTSAGSTIPMILWSRPPAARDRGHTLRQIAGGLPAELHERFEDRFGVTLVTSYAMTEDLCSIVNFPDRARRKLGAGMLGKPVLSRQHHVRIVDEDGRAVPPGTVGEIVKRGPGTMLGYYRDPARTAEALRDGWLHTGDYGRRDADGFYYFIGRKKDVIKRGGENVSAAQVEAALASHPDVAEVAVVGVPDPIRQEEIKAYVLLRPEKQLDSTTPIELWSHCASRLAPFAIPRYLAFPQSLPRTGSGKVQKEALKAGLPGRENEYDRSASIT
jgi:acyl-CoA synthetase (AMP-forming)/AMP-acid ligase II